ncbi:cell division protein FtsQ/DivIB [Arthrobacter sp. TMP15]|uniref:cell division protein FtsQ/DivIB n=1 Tax=Arthrobacter sp. TMP15 TaxID=3140789 RepID=UPI0031BB49B0
MVEPRKPRVIRTRPTDLPPAAAETPGTSGSVDDVGTADAGTADVGTAEASGANMAAAPPAGSVRSTSAKVSVERVPSTESEDAGAAQIMSPKTPKWKSLLARVGAGESTKVQPAATESGEAKSGNQAGPVKPGPAKSGPGKTGTAKPGTGTSKAVMPREPTNTAYGDSGSGRDATVLAFPVPEYKRRRRNLVFTAAGVLAVLVLVMVIALFSPVLAVKTVVFDGSKLVSDQVLQDAVAPILAKPLPQVTDVQVQDLLSDVIQVKSSRIEARPPSTLLIHIVERVPVALLKNDDDYLLVDQDGVQLGSTKDPGSVALPLIDGGKAAIGQDTFQAMTAVLANLPQSILGQLANATAKSPDAVELKLADGRSIIWGNANDMELKAQVLEALLSAPPPTAAEGKPEPAPVKVFDVSAPRHPVTR